MISTGRILNRTGRLKLNKGYPDNCGNVMNSFLFIVFGWGIVAEDILLIRDEFNWLFVSVIFLAVSDSLLSPATFHIASSIE